MRGEQELGEATREGGFRVSFNVADLPAGEAVLAITGYDAEGAEIDTVSRRITAVPQPPASATIDASGGALGTPEGVVVIIPPGAVDAPTGFRVEDRLLEELPRHLFNERGVAPLLAIDFLPLEGVPDPEFRLLKPAEVQFPWPPRQGQKQQVGAGGVMGAVSADGAGLDFVSTMNAEGGMLISGQLGAPVVFGGRNLSFPGEPFGPTDLAELVGENLSGLPGELGIRIPGVPMLVPGVSNGGRSAIFLVPYGVVGERVRVQVYDRFTNASTEILMDFVDRPPPELTEAQSDAILTEFFDHLEAGIARLESEAFEGAPRVTRLNGLRAQMEADLGAPLAFWREAIADLRAEVEALPADERLAIAQPMASLPRTLQTMGISAPDRISDDDLCLSFLILRGLAQYWSIVLSVVPTALAGKLAGAVIGMFFDSSVAAFDQAFQAGACEESFRRRGLIKYECDFLAMLEEVAEEEEKTGQFEGQVEGIGTRTPSMLGISFGGVTSDLWGPFPITPGLGGVSAYLSGTQEFASLLDAIVFPDGSFTLPFIATDSLVDIFVTLPWLDEPYVLTDVVTPGDGETVFLPIFVPVPDVEVIEPDEPIAIDAAFEFRYGADVGLEEETDSSRAEIADLDGDGRLDVDLQVGVAPVIVDGVPLVESGVVARGIAAGQFESIGWGPLPLESANDMVLFVPSLVDVNGDGRLDRVGLNHTGQAIRASALLNESTPGNLNASLVTLLEVPLPPGSEGNVFCDFTGIAWGDFIPGGGIDLMVVSAPINLENPLEATDGAVILHENDGVALREVSRTPRRALSPTSPSLGSVGDLDGDGVPDAVFPLLGVAVFSDGDSLAHRELPDLCRTPTGSPRVNARVTQRPAWLDRDGDGRLEVLIARRNPAAMTCRLKATPGRELIAADEGLPLPANRSPASLIPTDLNNDGYTDLIVIDNDARLSVLRGQADGTFAAGDRGELTDVSDVVSAEFTGDGRPDLVIARVSGSSDVLAVSRLPVSGGAILVSAGGRPGVQIDIDPDGDGTYDLSRNSAPGPIHVGIGDAASVNVRAHFATGAVEAAAVAPGTLVELQAP